MWVWPIADFKFESNGTIYTLMKALEYLQLYPDETPPHLDDSSPFRVVVVVESDVTPEWQRQISDWLVRSGCRYMVAWGRKCSEWDDSVDEANLALFDFGEIPEDDFVMTAWHADVPLEEAFWFSQWLAMHPTLELQKTYILHISREARPAAMLESFAAARRFQSD